MLSLPKTPAISVVIPTYGMPGVLLTEKCIRSMMAFHAHLGGDLEVIIVEDTDDEETFDYLKRTVKIRNPNAKIVNRENGGFAKACNTGLSMANGQVTFLVNNDIEFCNCALQYLSDAVLSTRAGVIGTRLLYPQGTIQHAGVCFVPSAEGSQLPGYFDHVLRGKFHLDMMATVMRPSLVTGALLGIPRSTIDTVGLLDESFEFSAEDIDYCLRVIETGKDSLYFGYTSAFHTEGATRGKTPEEKMKLAPDVAEKEMRSLGRLFDKWNGVNWKSFSG